MTMHLFKKITAWFYRNLLSVSTNCVQKFWIGSMNDETVIISICLFNILINSQWPCQYSTLEYFISIWLQKSWSFRQNGITCYWIKSSRVQIMQINFKLSLSSWDVKIIRWECVGFIERWIHPELLLLVCSGQFPDCVLFIILTLSKQQKLLLIKIMHFKYHCWQFRLYFHEYWNSPENSKYVNSTLVNKHTITELKHRCMMSPGKLHFYPS